MLFADKLSMKISADDFSKDAEGAADLHSRSYRRDIDGLRAIAIIPVVFYHAGLAVFGGGYVGVDVFFVISGFLISSLISKEIGEGRFSFVSFYDRRIRRIFPALFAAALFTVVGSFVLLQPKELAIYGKSLVAMTLFVSNIFFKSAFAGDGYFGNAVEAQPLLHTWSLAVEEQFYIFFPIALILLERWLKRWIPAILIAGIGLSFVLSVWTVAHKPTTAFYLLPSRAWELLLGSFIALAPLPTTKRQWIREVMAAFGLALIVIPIFVYTKVTAFPGMAAAAPCLGAAVLIYAGLAGSSAVGKILSWAPFVGVGLISYSVYLWHWPIIVFTKYYLVSNLSPLAAIACVAASLGAGFLSYKFIEAPFRGKATRVSRRTLFVSALVLSMASMCVGTALYAFHGVPQRYSASLRSIITANENAKADYEEKCSNFRHSVKGLAEIDYCAIGSQPTKILFLGDSHVQQLIPLVETMSLENRLAGRSAIFAISTGCPPATAINVRDKRFHCDSFERAALARAALSDIDTVYIGFSTWWMSEPDRLCEASPAGRCLKTIKTADAADAFLKDLASQVRTLRAEGKRVILAAPFPLYRRSIPDLEIHNAEFSRAGFAFKPADVSGRLRSSIEAIAAANGTTVFDPRDALCNADICTYQTGGVSWYKDASHLTATKIQVVRTPFEAALARAFAH